MTKEEVLSWVKKRIYLRIYDDVELIGKIDGNDVYSLVLKRAEAEVPDIGLPKLIVIENGEPKVIIGSKSFDILHKLLKED